MIAVAQLSLQAYIFSHCGVSVFVCDKINSFKSKCKNREVVPCPSVPTKVDYSSGCFNEKFVIVQLWNSAVMSLILLRKKTKDLTFLAEFKHFAYSNVCPLSGPLGHQTFYCCTVSSLL